MEVMSQLQSDDEKCIYLTISHYHFILYKRRALLFIVPLERQCEDNEPNIRLFQKANFFYLMILPSSSICLRQIFQKTNEKYIHI